MGALQPSHALLESASCLVWSLRLVGSCFGGVQAGISDSGSLQGLVMGLKFITPASHQQAFRSIQNCCSVSVLLIASEALNACSDLQSLAASQKLCLHTVMAEQQDLISAPSMRSSFSDETPVERL